MTASGFFLGLVMAWGLGTVLAVFELAVESFWRWMSDRAGCRGPSRPLSKSA